MTSVSTAVSSPSLAARLTPTLRMSPSFGAPSPRHQLLREPPAPAGAPTLLRPLCHCHQWPTQLVKVSKVGGQRGAPPALPDALAAWHRLAQLARERRRLG